MDNAITYSRVSSKEQLDNNSLSFQGKALRDYANELHYTIVQEFRDEGISARGMNQRQGLLDAIEYACANLSKDDYFMVYDASRLCRQTSDAELVYLKLREHGIVITTTKREYLHNALGRRDWLRDSVEADYDSDAKSEATVERMLERAKCGAYVARAPFGYLNAKALGFESGPSLIVDPSAAELIKRAFEQALRGDSIEKITRWLMNTLVWSSRYKANNFTAHKKRVNFLLRNRVFIAKNLTKRMDEEVSGDWDPIIDVEVFDQVQAQLGGVRQWNRDDSDSFPFLGLFECAVCEHSYTKSTVEKKTGKIYRYYHCGNPRCKKTAIAAQDAVLQVEELLQTLTVPTALRKNLINQIRSDVQFIVSESEKKKYELRASLKESELKRDAYIEGLATGRLSAINPKTVEDLANREEQKITNLKSELTQMRIPENEWIEEALKVASELLCDPLSTWKGLEPVYQARFLATIFPSRLQCEDGKVQTHKTVTVYGHSPLIMSESVTKHPQRFEVQTPALEFLEVAWRIRSMAIA